MDELTNADRMIVLGLKWRGDPIVMVESEMIAFADRYDPQKMHNDPSAAKIGRFGQIIASGWHVLALVMGDNIRTMPFAGDILGISADDVRWHKPVMADDILVATRTITELRPSLSKPGIGIVRMNTSVVNQRNELVVDFSNLMQTPLERRSDWDHQASATG